MTKNNRFKKEVRAYQQLFNVSYMEALEQVSKPFITTPEMVALLPDVERFAHRPGLILITGLMNSGKTYLQRYLNNELHNSSDLRVMEYDPDKEMEALLKYMPSEKNPPLFTSTSDFAEPDIYAHMARMNPDVVSVPELRPGDKSVRNFIDYGHAVITTAHIHPAHALSFVHELYHEEPNAIATVQHTLNMVIDVSLIRGKSKSILLVSPYEVTPELFDAWRRGQLKEALKQQGYETAEARKQRYLESR